MISTLSTRLSKSEEFIKNTTVNTYTRYVKFNNDKKVYLNEDTSIPESDIPVRRYVRCSSLLYPNDIRICHDDITFTIYTINSGSNGHTPINNSRTITPLEIDSQGLIPSIQTKLREIQADLYVPYTNNYYNGCKFVLSHPTTMQSIQCNDGFVWIFGIVVNFNGKPASDQLVLYNRLTTTNLIGFNGTSAVTNHMFYPLVNGGINKMTVSSDELVTSQYINGFKTATLAEISTNIDNIAIHTILFTKKNQEQNNIKAHFTLAPHQDAAKSSTIHYPDDRSSPELEFYPHVYPARLTSFQCGSEDLSLFDFVVIKRISSSSTSSMTTTTLSAPPTDKTDSGRVSEIRIDVNRLRSIATLWWLKLKYFGTTKHELTIIKANMRILDSSNTQLETVTIRNHTFKRYSFNLQHAIVNQSIPLNRPLDLSNYPTADTIAIRNYCFSHQGLSEDLAFVTLKLQPLSHPIKLMPWEKSLCQHLQTLSPLICPTWVTT